ncbi:MAG: hypothetical protein BWY24_00479 [Microgenomates group bacterium ADurb.Bin219]|nr:MAG: hypothetical protein BWY24_00479 [Microgenomates group bacterium ADurb.Bin219]
MIVSGIILVNLVIFLINLKKLFKENKIEKA